jgi:formylglycine-generating enzyme required for sulfatase activity
MPLTTGQVLQNRYRIVKLLGQGGYGAVYRAWDMTFGVPCAVKENIVTSPDAQRQFEREARMLRILRHPNLPKVTDYFILPDQGQYLVMDFIDGEDLQSKLDTAGFAGLPESQALPWIIQACEALDYLHRQNPPVIHRDVKPANIKITPEGQAVLVDFGIAKEYDPQSSTTKGARAVTPGFAPVEQYSQGATDRRTDVYALGATLYAMLTGQPPVESVQRTLHESLVPPRQLKPAISPPTDGAIWRAMQMKPDLRFQSAAEFATALRHALTTGPVRTVSVQPAGIAPQPAGIAPQPYATAPGMPERPAPTLLTPVPPVVKEPPLPTTASAKTRAPRWVMIAGGALAGVLLLAGSIWLGGKLFGQEDGPEPTRTSLIKGVATSVAATVAQVRIATEAPSLGIGSSQVSQIDGMRMLYVPEGEFLMGSSADDPELSDDETPQHTVYLDAFWIDQTEVTNRQYALCVSANACPAPTETGSSSSDAYYADLLFSNYPVIYVSWEDARAYCLWVGRRLPTEAEWEKAARGPDGWIYPWGNESGSGSLANLCDSQCTETDQESDIDDGYADTAPVGSYPDGASFYGTWDMAGNVWEWVADWYTDVFYTSTPLNNPIGPVQGDGRSLRSGSWINQWNGVRSANRNQDAPDFASSAVGFRCAATP